MARVRIARTGSEQNVANRHEWPAVIYIWTFGMAVVSYVVARLVLDGKPHPYHWLAALAGGLLGIPLGWLWFRWRGDIF